MECVVRGGKMGGCTFNFDPPPQEIDVPHYFPDNRISRYQYLHNEICRRKSTNEVLFEKAIYKFVGTRTPFTETYL